MNENKIKKITNILHLLLPILSLVFLGLNIWLATKLSPLEQSLTVMAQEIKTIQDQHDYYQKNLFPGLVTKDEFNQVVTRIDKISARLDEVLGILLQKK